LQSFTFQGKSYTVTTSDVSESGESRGKDSAVKIGGGAALGALIGGLAGAGTAVRVFTEGKQVKIPSETKLDFTLQQPFDITYIPSRKSRSAFQSQDPNSAQPDAVPNASADKPPLN
jgi:hypothetical protein